MSAPETTGRLRGADAGNSIFGYPAQHLAFHREATLTLVGDREQESYPSTNPKWI